MMLKVPFGGGVVIGGGAFRPKRVVHRQGTGRRLI